MKRFLESFTPMCAGLALGLSFGQFYTDALIKKRIAALEVLAALQAKHIAELRARPLVNALPVPASDSPVTLTVEPR